MSPRKTEQLAQAERHVRDGGVIVTRQRDLIERLRGKGLSTVRSEELLVTFKQSQAIFEEDLARIAAKDGAP